ncbi:flagellar biosynthesis anti-sigma factor FlgM [Sutcliffiella horikoshii]|jgi:negative regulator of flagellin synthesis FlgM|uniref:Negative regulator of flagellin synthesis n=1 Tax=Sutcliffiella horikoshii TaxID=79883 RepID=A0A5D4T4P2_9BACI|nr:MULTISPECIES: flagellar biosynthesis anti-sigma factor FlgM [Bacillaceae]MEA3320510.1 flagellar biosynthesis anti-sigma factor FlgM [Bacillota bacterium]NMH75201.1 flagellar biosynthesis anti-sigma factor FlgM [Bacillus sp. RO2]TYS69881.1 flagellar biosynthesis anti-sigma factor FlgM [Sutcliffiella horikoshii]
MKINNLGPSGINPYKNQMKQQQAAKTNQTKSDQVEISSKAKELQERSQFAEARQEKVAKLKISVENGTYQIDSKSVANKMIDYYSNK